MAYNRNVKRYGIPVNQTSERRSLTTMTTNHRKQQGQNPRKAAFMELVTRIDAGLKAEQAAAKEGKYTAQLKRVAQTPALAGLQRYSPLNQLLILSQCPHATDTAGYVGWQERGYQVRKGEKAIYIVAPHEKRKAEGEEGEEDNRPVGFHRTPVFDISQVVPIKEGDQEEIEPAADPEGGEENAGEPDE
jgi:antirestriction protein ArdC